MIKNYKLTKLSYLAFHTFYSDEAMASLSRAISTGQRNFIISAQKYIFNPNREYLYNILINNEDSGILVRITNCEYVNIETLKYKIINELQNIKKRRRFFGAPRFKEIIAGGQKTGLMVKSFDYVKIPITDLEWQALNLLEFLPYQKQYLYLQHWKIPAFLSKIEFEVIKENV